VPQVECLRPAARVENLAIPCLANTHARNPANTHNTTSSRI
jgi:hypothetical protein